VNGRHAFVIVLAVLIASWTAQVSAHELRPAALSMAERAPGRFAVKYTPPLTARGAPAQVTPEFPAHCSLEGAVLDCGEELGLTGMIRFPDLVGTLHRVTLSIAWLDGPRILRVLDADEPSLLVYGAPKGAASPALVAVAEDYTALGLEHILSGFDHLLFVLGLALLLGFRRNLVMTVTAFTAAHSVTLVLVTLGLAGLPAAPVEATIALSILLLAVECARNEPSWTRRAPWAVAFTFGLLHGFGFAGALSDVGLPPQQRWLALVSFNVGVELGQLAVLGAAWGATRIVTPLVRDARVPRRASIYLLGGLSAYWSLERTWALLA
jgi:hydrogenase/urease accessory protein HupE